MYDLSFKCLLFNEKIMFTSHLLKSNPIIQRKKGNTYRAPILHLIIVLQFYWTKCVGISMSIQSKLDLIGLNK